MRTNAGFHVKLFNDYAKTMSFGGCDLGGRSASSHARTETRGVRRGFSNHSRAVVMRSTPRSSQRCFRVEPRAPVGCRRVCIEPMFSFPIPPLNTILQL